MAFKAGAIVGTAKLDTKQWNKGLKGMKLGTIGVMGAIVLAVKAVTDAIFAASKKSTEFQKEMTNVATIIDTTAISTQGLTMALFRLDPALGDTTELTKGLYQAFSAGAEDAEEALKITTDSAIFAKAALTDMSSSVDVLTTAINAYGKDVITTEKASDIFFTTIKKGKITGQQLASTIGNSIPLFASAGIELEELTSGIAAMTKQGINAANATTQLNAIVNSFLKPSEELTLALQSVGFESGAAFLEAEGLSGALELLSESSGGNADQLAKLTGNIRATKGAMALTGVGGKEFNKILKEMGDVTGVTKEAFDKQEKTFDTLKNSMAKTQIIVGNIINFFAKDVAKGMIKAQEATNKFLLSTSLMDFVADSSGNVAGAMEAIGTAMKPLAEVFGPLIKGFLDAVKSGMDDLGDNTIDASGAVKVLAGFTTGLASAFNIAFKTIGAFINVIKNMVNTVGNAIGIVGSFFDVLTGKKKFEDVEDQVRKTIKSFESIGEELIFNFEDVISTTGEALENFSTDVETLATEIEVSFTTSSERTKKAVKNNWLEMLTGMKATIDAMSSGNEDIKKKDEDAKKKSEEDTRNFFSKNEAAWKAHFGTVLQDIQEFASIGLGILDAGLSSWNNLSDELFSNQTAKIENEFLAREDALTNSLENGLITQAEFDAQSKALDDEKTKELNAVSKKRFDNKKALDISTAWMDAASSIMGWWSQAPLLGPIGGPIFAGVMSGVTTGMAIAQTAAIAGRQFVPQFQEGGTFNSAQSASGLLQMNEQGGELAKLPDGTVIVPNDISRQIASSAGGGQNTSIVINNPVVDSNERLNSLAQKISQMLGKRMRLAT